MMDWSRCVDHDDVLFVRADCGHTGGVGGPGDTEPEPDCSPQPSQLTPPSSQVQGAAGDEIIKTTS